MPFAVRLLVYFWALHFRLFYISGYFATVCFIDSLLPCRLFYISGDCDAVCSIAFTVVYFWLLRRRFFYIYGLYF
jgi:hypothetical protein